MANQKCIYSIFQNLILDQNWKRDPMLHCVILLLFNSQINETCHMPDHFLGHVSFNLGYLIWTLIKLSLRHWDFIQFSKRCLAISEDIFHSVFFFTLDLNQTSSYPMKYDFIGISVTPRLMVSCARVATVKEKSWIFWNFVIFWKSHGILTKNG